MFSSYFISVIDSLIGLLDDGLGTVNAEEYLFEGNLDSMNYNMNQVFWRAGYPERYFSTHSGRSGFVCHQVITALRDNRANNVTMEMIMMKR